MIIDFFSDQIYDMMNFEDNEIANEISLHDQIKDE